MNDRVRLRNIEPDDLPVFYEQQLDPDATRMAAFPSRDRASFDAHWEKNILGNPDAIAQTILVDGEVAGNIGSWTQEGIRLVGYWIGKEYWGKGVATQVSRLLLLLLSVLLFIPRDGSGQSVHSSASPITDTLLVRTQQWVDTWNQKDVEGMRRLHAVDVRDQRYGIGNGFTTMEWLLKELRETNFWNVTWSVKIVDPKVRMLGADAGLVSFRLIGNETPSGAGAHEFLEAFSLVFQRIGGDWLIVHVHDSTRLQAGS